MSDYQSNIFYISVQAWGCVLFIVFEGPEKTRLTNEQNSPTLETSVGTAHAILVSLFKFSGSQSKNEAQRF